MSLYFNPFCLHFWNLAGLLRSRYPMGTYMSTSAVNSTAGSCTAANVSSWIPSSLRTNLRCFWLVPNINARPFIDSYSHIYTIAYCLQLRSSSRHKKLFLVILSTKKSENFVSLQPPFLPVEKNRSSISNSIQNRVWTGIQVCSPDPVRMLPSLVYTSPTRWVALLWLMTSPHSYSVPVLDEAVPTTRDHFGRLVGMPSATDTNRIMCLEFAEEK